MAALVPFIDSAVGRFYGQVCDRWHLDPGAVFEADDDVLAFNVRAAFALQGVPEDPEDEAESKVVTDLERRMRAMQHG